MPLWFNLLVLSGFLSFLLVSYSRGKKVHIKINKLSHFIFCVGICVAFASNYSLELLRNFDDTASGLPNKDFKGYYSSGNTNAEKIFSDEQRIWFLTVTRFSVVQDASLTKIAQALFPVREFVVWVIVKDENSEERSYQSSSQSTTGGVLKTLGRFGIPFILIKNKNYLVAEDDDGFSVTDDSKTLTYRSIQGRQTGLRWIQQNVQQGVIVFGDGNFTFDYHFFHKVRKTMKVTAWPVGLHELLSISTPVMASDNRTIGGYYDSGGFHSRMKIVQGGFAINIEYLKVLEKNNLWKLTYDDFYNFDFAGIPLSDIQPLEKSCSKIYVWRTLTIQPKWPKPSSIKLKKFQETTNVGILLRNVYKYKYSEIVTTNEKRDKKKKPKTRIVEVTPTTY